MQAGYSWLGIAPEDKHLLNSQDKKKIEKACKKMEVSITALDHKIFQYHKLCRKYEKLAGTPQGNKLLPQIEALNHEMSDLSKSLLKSLKNTHL